MQKLATLFSSVLLVSGCLSAASPCPQGINLLPMYGRIKKCPEQLVLDQEFLTACDKQYKTRQEAAVAQVVFGWKYFYTNQLDVAMKRFNQAWLLDSTNADVYLGFGNILGLKHQFEETLPLFEKSILINPTNPNVWESASTSYGQMFFLTKNTAMLDKSISYLKKSLALNPANARAYGQLTSAYSYCVQKDSAKKYMALTDKLDPKAVNPEVRMMLRK